MRTYDLSPLFRTSVGFDRLSRLMDHAVRNEETAKGYPPYNIVKAGECDYRITLAVAGFSEEELDVVVQENTLTVSGRGEEASEEVEYLHKGIAGRAFERRFQLADTIKVKGASMENGLLHVQLERVIPDVKRPRNITIETMSSTMEEAVAK